MSKNKLSLYADKELQPWVVLPNYRKINNIIFNKNTAYVLAWLLFSIALAGPRVPINQSNNKQLLGSNIMLLVDLSQSMNAMDIYPSRLRRAKIEIHELLERAQSHRIGVSVFSARPHLLSPLTYDHKALKYYLSSLDDLSFPTLGSDPITAILFSQKELLKTKGASSIILLTDGDFPKYTEDQLHKLQQANIPLYILGIGTVEGEAIQTKDGTWLKYKNQAVVSRMDEDNLRSLAKKLKGKYSPVYDDASDWDALYTNGVTKADEYKNLNLKKGIVWKELFFFFLLPSIILFLIALNAYRFKVINGFIVIIFISFSYLPNNEAQAFELKFGQTEEQSAFRSFNNENYSKAEVKYKNIPGYIGYFGRGNSFYKMGHYQQAIQQYVSAILNSSTNKQRAKALYNLANSYFRTGNFSSAITTYKDVLQYQPNNKSCAYNIKVSQALKKNIEQRIKEKARIIMASRQGRGPRSASIADGTDISENTSVSMGGSEKTLNDDIPLPALPNINDEQVKKLILSGLKNIELAENGSNNAYIPQRSKKLTNVELINALQQTKIMSDSQHLLWKRLYEIEEGFPAPVEIPKTLPGLKPW